MTLRWKQQIEVATHHPDRYVLRIIYRDDAGRRSRRVISPVKMVGRNVLRALCLAREECRQFHLSRIEDVELIAANEVQMPVTLEMLDGTAAGGA